MNPRPRTSGATSGKNRFLDALATRLGVVSLIGALFGICLSAGLFFYVEARWIEDQRDYFEKRRLRSGIVASSDMNRLNLVVFEALRQGEMSPDLQERFEAGVDMLYVRTNHIQLMLDEQLGYEISSEMVANLRQVIELADMALNNNFSDLETFAGLFIAATENARRSLIVYTDETRRIQEDLLAEQTRAVARQTMVLWGVLTTIALLGAGLLRLLRREVLTRMARDRAERRVDFLAYFDTLTELPNRVQFQDRLRAALEQGQPVALILLDLDDFKGTNDTFGPEAGDRVLIHVARCLRDLTRIEGGFAARTDGDGFALALETDDVTGLRAICERLLRDLGAPVDLPKGQTRTCASLGVATSTQVRRSGQASVSQMTRVAEFALRTSKESGKGCHTFYDADLERRYFERREMLDALPAAIEDRGIDIFLQPKVSLPDARIYGFEALARWCFKGQMVMPDRFIALAEESGHVLALDACVLEQAAHLVAAFNAAQSAEFEISVNLSALHFNHSDIVTTVRDVLDLSGLRPNLLTLEITETTELADWSQALRVISALRALGCRIAIDDFGTGFSSLAYLRMVDADELKIDKSLVTEIETSEEARYVFEAVVDLAESLRLQVVVEGIETERQARVVAAMGVRKGQGYHFGKPEDGFVALERLIAPGTAAAAS